jgi:hypothetical protein
VAREVTSIEARLSARGIEKSYGATRALAGVDFEVRAGEVRWQEHTGLDLGWSGGA